MLVCMNNRTELDEKLGIRGIKCNAQESGRNLEKWTVWKEVVKAIINLNSVKNQRTTCDITQHWLW